MSGRWLLRVSLIVGAFFLGSFGSFFLLILVTWDQGVIDFFSVLAGIVSSVFTFLTTKPITQLNSAEPRRTA